MSELIFQANAVTNARYSLSAVQKNAIYHIIDFFQEDLKMIGKAKKKGDIKEVERLKDLLFREQEITFKIKNLVKNNNYDDLIAAIKDLMKKPVEYKLKEKQSEFEIISNIISSVKHEKDSRDIQILIPKYALPFLFSLDSGFTSYQKTIALSLRSKWAKRIYELCSRWKDKGGKDFDLADFRNIIGLENEYTGNAQLKQLLNRVKKEINSCADLTFEYTLKKKDSRSYNRIIFKINYTGKTRSELEKKKLNIHSEKSEPFVFTYNFLLHTYPSMFDSRAQEITERLQASGDLSMAYKRFKKLNKEVIDGKKNESDRIPLTKYILNEDFNIKY